MNLADVFTVLFVILGFVIVSIGYWLMAAALFPRMVEQSAAQLGRAPIKTMLLGAILFVPLVTISLKLPGPGKMVGVGIALLLTLAALFGSAGLALRIGQGMPSDLDDRQPWRRMLRGSIVLSLTFVMPAVGWFLVLPYAYLSGFGAFVLMLFRKSAPELQPAPVNIARAPVRSEPLVLPVTVP